MKTYRIDKSWSKKNNIQNIEQAGAAVENKKTGEEKAKRYR